MNRDANQSRDVGRHRSRTTRYDLVLAAFPLVFILSLGSGVVLDLSLTTTIGVAGVVGLGLLAEALFHNPPIHPGEGSESA